MGPWLMALETKLCCWLGMQTTQSHLHQRLPEIHNRGCVADCSASSQSTCAACARPSYNRTATVAAACVVTCMQHTAAPEREYIDSASTRSLSQGYPRHACSGAIKLSNRNSRTQAPCCTHDASQAASWTRGHSTSCSPQYLLHMRHPRLKEGAVRPIVVCQQDPLWPAGSAVCAAALLLWQG